MKLTKTGLFVHKIGEQRISLQVKFSLCSEIAIHSENFAIVEKFHYCENSLLLRKFRYVSEIC